MATQIKPAAKHLYEEDFFVWSQKQASLLREPIRTQRSELLNDLTPSLRRHLADSLSDVYERARHDAEGSLRDHGEHAADALPATCPYTLDQITGDWLP